MSLPWTSIVTSPGNPLASTLNSAGSAGIPDCKPGPLALGDVSSSISWMKGAPAKSIELNNTKNYFTCITTENHVVLYTYNVVLYTYKLINDRRHTLQFRPKLRSDFRVFSDSGFSFYALRTCVLSM